MLRALISEVEASELKKKLGRLDLIKSISEQFGHSYKGSKLGSRSSGTDES